MKKKGIRLILVVALAVSGLRGLHMWLIDGLDGLFWGSLLKEDTAFATGYTDSAWRSIRIGMTESSVKSTVGAPFGVWTNRDQSVGMQWSRSPADTHYRLRVILFRDGKVMEKRSEFYVD